MKQDYLHPRQLSGSLFHWSFLLLLLLLGSCATSPRTPEVVPKYSRFEQRFASTVYYTNALQQVRLKVTFNSPSGESQTVDGFWDGLNVFKVRFMPDQIGSWSYNTSCSDLNNAGLHNKKGRFICTVPVRKTRFDQHGPVGLSLDRHSLIHQDGTPFFYLADTAWNGPLLSQAEDWQYYCFERARQHFNAVQWVTTQWRASSEGDLEHRRAFSGTNLITLDPAFFRRLDEKVEVMNRTGLLSVPVLLWAIGGGSNPAINPGYSLPEDQAILLARYMVARWQGYQVIWILNGDGQYGGAHAERWKRIGRGVFGDIHHAPVALHPGALQWPYGDFTQEKWLDIAGYQSAHNETEENLRWIFSGPATTQWKVEPIRPVISLEGPYENHQGGANGQPLSALAVRRASYWSLLSTPPAGVTYGGHGVWGWDNGSRPPEDHPKTGIPLPWQQALHMAGAEHMTILGDFFNSIDFWRLRPAQEILALQPGKENPRRHIAAARTGAQDLLVLYTPEERTISLHLESLPSNSTSTWVNPRTGERIAAIGVLTPKTSEFPTPAPGDWLLMIRTDKR